MTTPDATLLTPDGWARGRLRFAEGRIEAVDAAPLPAGAAPEPPYLVPGFVDLHVHGGDGADAMEGEASVRAMLRFHARHGTTAMCPTTMTAPADAIEAALAGIAAVAAKPEPGAARVLGAHLEGPFINPNKLGAQPPHTLPPDAALALSWHRRFGLRVATVAPEMPGGLDLVRALGREGVRVQTGHSLASADEARQALDAGATGFTHLFNAMSGIDHRAPGVLAAALAYASHAELIADLQHVAPAAIHAALRAIPLLYAVTDSTAAAGRPDGDYRIGFEPVVKRGERVTLRDGRTLAGSVLTLDRALGNLVSIGVPLNRAAEMVSTRPAAYLGRTDLGRLVPGAAGDAVLLDPDLVVREVWIGGEAILG